MFPPEDDPRTSPGGGVTHDDIPDRPPVRHGEGRHFGARFDGRTPRQMGALTHRGRASACADLAARRLLLRYGLRRATEGEQRVFEEHLLTCDACYEDFVAVWRVTELVEEWRDTPESNSSALPLVFKRERVHMGLSTVFWLVLAMGMGVALGRFL